MTFRTLVDSALRTKSRFASVAQPNPAAQGVAAAEGQAAQKKEIIDGESVAPKDEGTCNSWLECPHMKKSTKDLCMKFMSFCAKEKCKKQYMRIDEPKEK